MQKYLMLLRFFFVICFHLTFTLSVEATTNNQSLKTIIQSYRNCNLNCLELKFTDFANKYSNEKPQVLEVVYNVLLAEKFSAEFDRKNNKSEVLYKKASTIAQKLEREDLIIWTQTHLGFYYYRYSDLIQAFPYFLNTFKKIENHDKHDLIEAALLLKKNAFFFGFIEDFKKEETYLKEALKYCIPNSESHTEILNNLGSCYLKQNQLDLAESYFKQTRDLALQNKQQIRYAKALGELAKIHLSRNDFTTAKSLLIEDIKISKQYHNDRNTMYAQIQLAKLYIGQKDLENAKTVINEALNYVRTRSHLASFEFEITELLLDIALQKKDLEAELNFRRALDSLNKVIALTDGRSVVDQLNLQAQKEQIKSQLEVEQNKLEKASLVEHTWIIVSILLLIILFIIFIIYRRKLSLQEIAFEKNILTVQLEQIQSEAKLHETRISLSSYQVYLSETNEQLTKVQKELKKLKNLPINTSKVKERSLHELLESHLMTKENWLQFKSVFIAEQPDYYHYLTENFPGLTEANLRIILLQKIGLKNQETAQILGITLEAVKKSKQRLKKRFESNYSEIFNEI